MADRLKLGKYLRGSVVASMGERFPRIDRLRYCFRPRIMSAAEPAVSTARLALTEHTALRMVKPSERV